VRRFLVIEGLIGVGKTTLCRLLQDTWGAKLVLEPAETNPFLGPFYEDPERYAFAAQMFYLVSRWRQQDTIRQPELFSELVVSDYLFAKDRLFAEKTLNAVELELYDRFASALGERTPVPDLVIYLEAPVDTIMERIAQRGAVGETAITRSYLEDLKARYEQLLTDFTDCPILRMSNNDLNYRDDDSARKRVLSRIERALNGDMEANAPGSETDREAQASLFPEAPT
jgi:deoxyadenosine/deoxycytidine kinase